MEAANRYFIINKPLNMVSQFVSTIEEDLLGDLDFTFPEHTHAIGRLDKNSEGLLILTTNKKITKLLFNGPRPHLRVYLVMVKNKVMPDKLNELRAGVSIRVKGGEHYTTPPCDITIENDISTHINFGYLPPEHIPHTWLRIPLYEGKFRQVRKMVAAINHRCIRLVRVEIDDIILGDLQPGCVKEIEEDDFFKKLHLQHTSAKDEPAG